MITVQCTAVYALYTGTQQSPIYMAATPCYDLLFKSSSSFRSQPDILTKCQFLRAPTSWSPLMDSLLGLRPWVN